MVWYHIWYPGSTPLHLLFSTEWRMTAIVCLVALFKLCLSFNGVFFYFLVDSYLSRVLFGRFGYHYGTWSPYG